MVEGFVSTFLVCLVGGVLGEAIRILGLLREGKRPNTSEWLASAGLALLGAGAVLYGWDTPRPAIELATLGAAFPTIFSAGIRAAVPPSSQPPPNRAEPAAEGEADSGQDPRGGAEAGIYHIGPAKRNRRTIDYVASRF